MLQTDTTLNRVKLILALLTMYFGAGFVASYNLPLVSPPVWVAKVISLVFEPAFVTLFGKW